MNALLNLKYSWESKKSFSERVGISLDSLRKIEKGEKVGESVTNRVNEFLAKSKVAKEEVSETKVEDVEQEKEKIKKGRKVEKITLNEEESLEIYKKIREEHKSLCLFGYTHHISYRVLKAIVTEKPVTKRSLDKVKTLLNLQ